MNDLRARGYKVTEQILKIFINYAIYKLIVLIMVQQNTA